MVQIRLSRSLSIALVSAALACSSPLLAQAQAPSSPVVRGLPDFTVLVEKAGPAVVNIRTTERAARTPRGMPPLDENDPFYEFFRRFMPPGHPGFGGGRPGPGPESDGDQRPEPRQRGVGSGFIISADGYLLSNHHVVDGADEVIVTLTDKREFKAKIVGSDARTDVALLKIEAQGLPTLKIGNPDQLRVGEWVLAIGSPFGLDNTVTAGIVSAKSRDTGDYLPFIQTDVAVNPGNSGGPLLNMAGEVVGINSQIYSRTGGFMGISFAIPIDEAQRVSDQLRKSGRVVRGRIGVAIDEVTREVAEALGMKTASGALVRNVEPKGPADQAGVEAGDIVLKFNGKTIEKVSDLPRLVGNTAPGSQATLEVWRRGEVKILKVKVGQIEPEKAVTSSKSTPKSEKPASVDWLGLSLADLGEASGESKASAGVQIVAVKGPAERVGLRQGDIILSLNNVQVRSVAQFVSAAEKLDRKRTVVLLVRRGEGVQFVPLKP
ncbi:MAG: putative periplasmic serine endoprotease DegP-like precursor [Pseudomonadota bacterium]|jgi:serine protease Do